MIFREAHFKISLSTFLSKDDSSFFFCWPHTTKQHFLKGPQSQDQISSIHCHAEPYCAKQASQKLYFIAFNIQRNRHDGYGQQYLLSCCRLCMHRGTRTNRRSSTQYFKHLTLTCMHFKQNNTVYFTTKIQILYHVQWLSNPLMLRDSLFYISGFKYW